MIPEEPEGAKPDDWMAETAVAAFRLVSAYMAAICNLHALTHSCYLVATGDHYLPALSEEDLAQQLSWYDQARVTAAHAVDLAQARVDDFIEAHPDLAAFPAFEADLTAIQHIHQRTGHHLLALRHLAECGPHCPGHQGPPHHGHQGPPDDGQDDDGWDGF